MIVDPSEVAVRDLAAGYADNDEEGVVAFGGALDVRPAYQREFIYQDVQRDAVIDTVKRGFPLNVMYWAVREDEGFEVIDGQQRTISICQYVDGDFAIDGRYFHNLMDDEKEAILDYKLMVYRCSGTSSEKLEWFKTINIAGEELTDQELRNAVYNGPWVADAKRHFSKTGCPAYTLAKDYLRGRPIRQEFLETAIRWINEGDIDGYMANNQHEPTANELWLYFQGVIAWVTSTFPTYRSEMKGVPWGPLFNEFGYTAYDPAKLEAEISRLMVDEDVTKKPGIYSYVLTDDEKYLSIRAFTANQKREAFERQKGVCPKCGKKFDIEDMEADHLTPWSQGGRTIADNCQMLCRDDNRRKGAI